MEVVENNKEKRRGKGCVTNDSEAAIQPTVSEQIKHRKFYIWKSASGVECADHPLSLQHQPSPVTKGNYQIFQCCSHLR